jgi:hypothetical protein
MRFSLIALIIAPCALTTALPSDIAAQARLRESPLKESRISRGTDRYPGGFERPPPSDPTESDFIKRLHESFCIVRVECPWERHQCWDPAYWADHQQQCKACRYRRE